MNAYSGQSNAANGARYLVLGELLHTAYCLSETLKFNYVFIKKNAFT